MSEAGEAGFTLIEMLVVIAITALISAISFPALDRTMRAQSFESSADTLDLGLREARAEAIRKGMPVRFLLGMDRRSVVRDGAASLAIPAAVTLTLPLRGITFFGDGTATGGEIVVTGDGRERRLAIDPGSGAVTRTR